MERYCVEFEEMVIEDMHFDLLTPYFRGQTMLREQWTRASDGVIHREGGPAILYYEPGCYPNGGHDPNPSAWFWMKDGLVHRDLLQAFMASVPGFQLRFEGDCQNGKLHNGENPALLIEDWEGKNIIKLHYRNGVAGGGPTERSP